MILRPHSLETFKTFQQNAYTQYGSSTDFRKKIQNFSFLPNDKIGRGYSSIVYKGQNDITKQSVAIKVIQLKSLRDQNTKRFLQNQLECLRKLNHQNNLKYINSFITSNNCYIITELYPEGDLSKILKQKIRFTQIQAFYIFNQFYQGYLHFYSKGYIHRDIKPSNVLIQKKFNRIIYAMADFGFVKKLQQHPKDSFNVGTPVYMPPQSISSNIYTTKSDIWSMGIMLFELVYGFLPFQSKSEIDLKRQICNKQIKLQQIQQSIKIQTSYEFKSFLLNCLRKNPQNRISLQDMKQHQWFRKRTSNLFTISNENQQNKKIQLFSRKSKISISKDRKSQQNKYGYIGNQAIKRQKSIQGNNQYSLKNYFKNPQKKLIIKNYQTCCNKQNQIKYLNAQKQNISFNIGMIKEKFNQIDLSVQRQNQKAKTLGLLSNDNFLNQTGFISHKNKKQSFGGYLIKNTKTDLNMNTFDSHNQSLKNINTHQKLNLFSPIINKNSLNTSIDHSSCRSSLLQGMKGVINIKNNQISKLRIDSQNNCNSRGSLIKKQSFLKRQNMPKEQQISTSIDQSTQKNNSSYKKSFIAEKLSIESDKKSCKIQQILYSPKQSISPNQFIVKFIHILRYIFQTLSLDQIQNKDKYHQTRTLLSQFLSIYLLKLKKCLIQKQNIFNLQNWNKFILSDKYQTFKEVIEKYYQRYSLNQKINKVMKQCDHNYKNIIFSSLFRYQKLISNLFEYTQQITNLNRQINKKSIKNNPLNTQIILIYNYHKCLEIISKVINNDKKFNFINDINAQKDFQQLTTKNKDPFKIPKILIQLKKKLINFQSNHQINLNESNDNIKSNRNNQF